MAKRNIGYISENTVEFILNNGIVAVLFCMFAVSAGIVKCSVFNKTLEIVDL